MVATTLSYLAVGGCNIVRLPDAVAQFRSTWAIVPARLVLPHTKLFSIKKYKFI